MLVSTSIAALSGVVVAILAGGSGTNMLQTYRIANKTSSPPSLDSSKNWSTQDGAVEHLKSLNRKELLELFSASRVCAPSQDLQGDWNGALLDNNGYVMTKVSSIITNGLFGMGRTWNGKSFGSESKGMNRFFGRRKDNDANTRIIETEHGFEYTIQQSKILPTGQESIQLKYSKYHLPISMFYTMMDELRLVPGHDDVLIGMGCMGWSGGMLNCQPFCLWKADSKKQK